MMGLCFHHDSGHKTIAADISIRWPIVISKKQCEILLNLLALAEFIFVDCRH